MNAHAAAIAMLLNVGDLHEADRWLEANRQWLDWAEVTL